MISVLSLWLRRFEARSERRGAVFARVGRVFRAALIQGCSKAYVAENRVSGSTSKQLAMKSKNSKSSHGTASLSDRELGTLRIPSSGSSIRNGE